MFGSKPPDCRRQHLCGDRPADTIEACQGRVAGPVDTLAEALAILDSGGVAGAIVDCELDDAAALVLRLAERGVPLVMLTSTPLPPALDARNAWLRC